MTVKQASTLWHRSRVTIADWCKRGIVQAEMRYERGLPYWWITQADMPVLKKGRPVRLIETPLSHDPSTDSQT